MVIIDIEESHIENRPKSYINKVINVSKPNSINNICIIATTREINNPIVSLGFQSSRNKL